MKKIKQLDQNIKMAQTYKYICELEVEKDRRKGSIYHDFTDHNPFYKNKIAEYEQMIQNMYHEKSAIIKRTFIGNAIGMKAAVFGLFILTKTF